MQGDTLQQINKKLGLMTIFKMLKDTPLQLLGTSHIEQRHQIFEKESILKSAKETRFVTFEPCHIHLLNGLADLQGEGEDQVLKITSIYCNQVEGLSSSDLVKLFKALGRFKLLQEIDIESIRGQYTKKAFPLVAEALLGLPELKSLYISLDSPDVEEDSIDTLYKNLKQHPKLKEIKLK